MLNAIFLRTDEGVAELAAKVSVALAARVDHRPDFSELRVAASALVPGAAGEFHGVIVRPDPQWPFYLPGEFKASDAYEVELRIRRSDVDRSDVDQAIADVVFARVSVELDLPALHVYHLEWLLAAYRPGMGQHNFGGADQRDNVGGADRVSVYSEHADRWGDWVFSSPATRRDQDTGGTLEDARDLLREGLFAVARDAYPDTVPVVELSQGPLPFETEPVQWLFRVAAGAVARADDAPKALGNVANALDAHGWWVAGPPYLVDGRWAVEAIREGHRVTATVSPADGILRLSAQTPWYPPSGDR